LGLRAIALSLGGVTAMAPSFFEADQRTHRRVMIVGTLFCASFIAISFSVRSQPEQSQMLLKADRLVRAASEMGDAR
jgi:hypothetical protein